MLPVYADTLDPLPELHQLGIDARLAWHGDHETPALVFISPALENLAKLDQWLQGRPRIAVAA